MIIYTDNHEWEIPPSYPNLDYFYRNPIQYSYDGNILIDASKDDGIWILMDIPFLSREAGILFKQMFITQTAFLMAQEKTGKFSTSEDFSRIYRVAEEVSDAGIITPTKNWVLGVYTNSYISKVPAYRLILSIDTMFKNDAFLEKLESTFKTFLKDLRIKVAKLPEQND